MLSNGQLRRCLQNQKFDPETKSDVIEMDYLVHLWS